MIIENKLFRGECLICDSEINQYKTGEPFLVFKNKPICFDCYISLIPEIYKMAGYGDGGIIHIAFSTCLTNPHNRSKRIPIKNYKKTFRKLLHKYNFECVDCGSKENLTIDHIRPVSKGGSDDIKNLQIMCKSCNSKKGSNWNEKN
jgi:DNA-directed RNA polymerase subunit RPC12/RpoP